MSSPVVQSKYLILKDRGERLKIITVTELGRKLRRILDQLAVDRDEVVIEGSRQPVARLLPVPPRQTAIEVLADLYRTLPEDAAATWEADSRNWPSS